MPAHVTLRNRLLIKLNIRIPMVGTNCKFVKIPVYDAVMWTITPSMYNINSFFLIIYIVQRIQTGIVALICFHGRVSFRTKYHAKFDLTLLHTRLSANIDIWYMQIIVFFTRNISMKINRKHEMFSLIPTIYIYNINCLKLSLLTNFIPKKNWLKIFLQIFFRPTARYFYYLIQSERFAIQPRAS